MTYTIIPSVKGQVTIPADIREKYNISQKTPMLIEDTGKGVLTIKIMQMIHHDAIQDYETDEGFGVHFKKGIDSQALIDEIKKIDG